MTTITDTKMMTNATGSQFFAVAMAGPTKVSISIFRSATSQGDSEIWVTVHNAANLAWSRGISVGKQFRTIEDATGAYKRVAIRDAVKMAYEASLEALPA